MALFFAACGDDGDGDSDSAAATGDTAEEATTDDTAGDAEPGGDEPTGEPIKVMTIAPVNTNLPSYPNIPGAADVYEQWINDNGGINGRPLEVVNCDDMGDANEAANCARQAVEEDMVAVVGSFVFDASRIISVLEEGGVAWFGACCPLVEQEFSSDVSFVLGSLFAGSAGTAVKMAEDGCESPVTVVLDIPAADLAETTVTNGLESVGYDSSKMRFIRIPIEAQDYSPQVAEATDGTDCLYGGISDTNWAAWLPAMRSAGADQRLYGLQGNLNSKIVEEFPDLTDGAVITNSYPHIDGEMWEDYRAALEEYDAPDLDWNSLAGLGTWTAYVAFTDIVSGLDEVDAQTFMEAAASTSELDTGGMVPVLDLTEPYTGLGGAFPRIFNRAVYYDQAEGGEVVPLETEPTDMTDALEGTPS